MDHSVPRIQVLLLRVKRFGEIRLQVLRALRLFRGLILALLQVLGKMSGFCRCCRYCWWYVLPSNSGFNTAAAADTAFSRSSVFLVLTAVLVVFRPSVPRILPVYLQHQLQILEINSESSTSSTSAVSTAHTPGTPGGVHTYLLWQYSAQAQSNIYDHSFFRGFGQEFFFVSLGHSLQFAELEFSVK